MIIWRGPALLLQRRILLLSAWARRGLAILPLIAAALLSSRSLAADYGDAHRVLPAGTDFGETRLDEPREIFKTDISGGTRSYLVRLGDLAFSSPSLLGPTAQKAGLSCGTCHKNGAGNVDFFIPGASARPGTFDTSTSLFNPHADNGVFDPVRIPSLRGTRFLAPYGHDGRFASLREFIRTAITVEFGGEEPSAQIVEAIAAYLNDIEFLPNARLRPGGRLRDASALEARGEALFYKPFPRNPELSCAGCHVPSAGFVDHRTHDVGSGGLEKTATLRNANFNAPYFHDGRYSDYGEVVEHFDRTFSLGLNAADRKALVTYLNAIGDGEAAISQAGVDDQLVEIDYFLSVLDTAIPEQDQKVIAMAVDTVVGELRELGERFPDHKNVIVTSGRAERQKARAAIRDLVLELRRLELAAETEKFDEAIASLARYRARLEHVTVALEDAEPYSLFNPELQRAQLAALAAMQNQNPPQ